MDPDEMLEFRRKTLESEDAPERHSVENMLKRYDAYLMKKERSVNTRKGHWATVESFFQVYELNLKFSDQDKPKGEGEEARAPTKAEIRKLVKLADVREKAMVLTLKDTGLRASDLATLKVGQVDLDTDFSPLVIRTKKQSIIQKTFVGPEAKEAIRDYLEYRRGGTRRIKPEKIMDESPLFRTENVKVRHMNAKNVSVALHRLIKTSRIEGITGHSLRRFFETRLEDAGIHATWIDRMTGHRPLGSRRSYSKPRDEELMQKYIEAYPYLQVFEPSTNHERLELFEENLAKKDTVIEALLRNGQNKDKALEELKQVVDALNEKVEERGDEVERLQIVYGQLVERDEAKDKEIEKMKEILFTLEDLIEHDQKNLEKWIKKLGGTVAE